MACEECGRGPHGEEEGEIRWEGDRRGRPSPAGEQAHSETCPSGALPSGGAGAGPVRGGRGDLFHRFLKASPLPSPGTTLGLWGTSLVTEEAGCKGDKSGDGGGRMQGRPSLAVISKGSGQAPACLLSPQEGDGGG